MKSYTIHKRAHSCIALLGSFIIFFKYLTETNTIKPLQCDPETKWQEKYATYGEKNFSACTGFLWA
jgi:hypothetical protein